MIQSHQNNNEEEHARIRAHLARSDLWLRLPMDLERDFCRHYDQRAAASFNSTITYVGLLYIGLGIALVVINGLRNLGFWPASYSVFMVLIAFGWLLSVVGVLQHRYQQLMASLIGAAVCFAVVHPSLISDPLLVHLIHVGTVYIMVLAYLGLNLRLPYALLAACGGGLIALILLLSLGLRIDWHLTLSTYLGGSLLGIVLRFRDERYLRRDFIQARLLTLDNARIQSMADELERLSFLDGLTGLANRRYFDRSYEKAWRSCMRDKAPLTVLMLDVDFFKPYNDHYGHQQGDQALRDIARAISFEAGRPQDLVARYGGEEFIVMLPWVDEAAAAHMAERLLQAVRDLALPHAASSCGDIVTISAGVATTVPRQPEEMGTLISAADRALYQAKRDGRNCWRRALPV